MDDIEIARKLKRAPSVTPEIVRGLVAFFETTREEPRMPIAQELDALIRLAESAAKASDALVALGWYGAEQLERTLPEFQTRTKPQSLSDIQRGLADLAGAAMLSHKALEQTCAAGRPASNISQMIQILATIIEERGGVVDATQGGEVCQAFGVVVEVLGLSVANHRETVRAALKRRPAKK